MTSIRQRFNSQLLVGARPKSTLAVVEHLLAVQAQDPLGMRLAIRPRSRDTTAAEVDASLSAGTVVVGWLCRGTLHLVAAEDYWWLHALTVPQLATGNARRLRQEGVSASATDRGVLVVEKALANGACSRAELRDHLDRAGVPTAQQALVHVLFRASILGTCVRGPMRDGEQVFVDPREWIGPKPQIDQGKWLGELAVRYRRGHAPADERDLAKWAGITLTSARSAMRATSPEDGSSSARPQVPRTLLLGSYDPLLHGWSSREWITGEHKTLVTSNGLFRPFILAKGKAVGLWRIANGEVTLAPFTELTHDEHRRVMAEVRAVKRYLGAS